VKREGEELINRGDQLRNRLSERKKALEEVDRIVEQGNTALKSLLDSLDPPDGN
jgi:chaperonin cofactor prefoldin